MKSDLFRSKIRWADSIDCYEFEGDLWVIGDVLENGSTDLMNAYETSGADSPHVQFANASTDEELIKFTRTYGPYIVSGADAPRLPVWIASAHRGQRVRPKGAGNSRDDRAAYVSLKDLRAEQAFYATLLDVTHGVLHEDRAMAEQQLLDNKPTKRKLPANRSDEEAACAQRLQILIEKAMPILPSTRQWEEAFKREHDAHLKGSYELGSNWIWNTDRQMRIEADFIGLEGVQARLLAETKVYWLDLAVYYLKKILVTILDSFPSQLRWDVGHTEEVPAQDLLFGIRPVLMAMLRRDVMFKREVRICIRESCGRYFVATRIDRRCCSAKCAEMLNNRRQYLRTTKPKRQKEAANRKKRKQKG